MKETRDGYGRRPLTEGERIQLLDLPLTGIYSTLTMDERIHSVPVHFLAIGGELCILTKPESVKCRNTRRTGRATLCVETTVGGPIGVTSAPRDPCRSNGLYLSST